MPTQSLLFKNRIAINENISVMIPTVGEIIDNEDAYYSIVSALTSSPVDLMVQLDDIGIDFTSINDYELFLLLFSTFKEQDTSLVFGELDLSKFTVAINPQNENIILIDREHDIRIDQAIYEQIANTLRQIHGLEKNLRKPANGAAKAFMLERARVKLNREKRRVRKSQLETLIVAMVNTEQYKYNFESTRMLSIFQFNECVQQIIKKVNYDNQMHGVYAGTVSVKDLNPKDLNWLEHN